MSASEPRADQRAANVWPFLAGSRRLGDEIHPRPPNGDLRPTPGFRRKIRQYPHSGQKQTLQSRACGRTGVLRPRRAAYILPTRDIFSV